MLEETDARWRSGPASDPACFPIGVWAQHHRDADAGPKWTLQDKSMSNPWSRIAKRIHRADAKLSRLKQTQEANSTLLERTTVLLTSNLGNASNHSNRSLPVLLVGGRLKHGQHLVFDPPNATPLCDVFLSMLQQLEIESASFGTSTGISNGLELL